MNKTLKSNNGEEELADMFERQNENQAEKDFEEEVTEAEIGTD